MKEKVLVIMDIEIILCTSRFLDKELEGMWWEFYIKKILFDELIRNKYTTKLFPQSKSL